MHFVVGTALDLIVYFALRGGLFSGDFTSNEVNPYGITAVAGLVGMFSKQATAKLAQLFDIAFAIQAARDVPRIDSLEPAEVPAGADDTPVKVRGSGFADDATALAGQERLDTSDVSATELTLTVPANLLTDPGQLAIRIDNPDPTVAASAPAELHITDAT